MFKDAIKNFKEEMTNYKIHNILVSNCIDVFNQHFICNINIKLISSCKNFYVDQVNLLRIEVYNAHKATFYGFLYAHLVQILQTLPCKFHIFYYFLYNKIHAKHVWILQLTYHSLSI